MKASEIHPAMQSCLGFHEAFRRLGFKADDIFVGLNRKSAYVILRTQGKEFVAAASDVPMECSQDEFAELWEKVATAANSREIPCDDLDRFYRNCLAYTNSAGFVAAILMKGIELPRKAGASGACPTNASLN